MSDGPSQPSVEDDAGAKPSIAEVAAWLRRAAESREGVEDLRPLRRTTPVPSPFVEPAAEPASEPVAEEAPQDRIVAGEPPPASEELVAEEPLAGEAAAPALDDTTTEAPPAADGEVPDVVAEDAPTVEATSHEAPAGHAPSDQAPRDEASTWGAPAAGVTLAPDPGDEKTPAPDGGADAVPAAPPGPTSFDRDRSTGSGRRWSRNDEGWSQDDAPAHDAPAERAASSATDAAAMPVPEPDVPMVSPAMALFASAVVRHNTAEVAAVRLSEEDLPKAEALVEEELPLAVDTMGSEAGGSTAPVDEPDAEGVVDPVVDPVVERVVERVVEPDLVAEAPTGRSVASLFDLDLAELAARARGRAEERALATPPAGSDVDRLREDLEPGHLDERWAPATSAAVGPAPVDAPDEQVETSDLDLSWDIDAYQPAEGDLREEEEDEDAAAEEAAHQAFQKAPAAAALAAALARRRAKRKRYPRGQLKERIGFLRRVRAMLGVVVLTIVLGVAAGAAIGAFLLFLAFAIRSAITSS